SRARVRSQSSTVMLGAALPPLHGLPFNSNCTAVMAGVDLVSGAAEAAPADAPCKVHTSSHRGCKRWGSRRGTRVCTLFLQQGARGPWHDGARPATSRRVLATRPISLPERPP